MKIKGIISAMITPFNADESINYDATEKLIDFLISSGVTGLFILGTNGEAHRLSWEEKLEFSKHVIQYTNQRVPVYVGSGFNSTKETIDFAMNVEILGADALSIVSPSFVKITQEELITYYKDVAEKGTIPIILYNMPKLTGVKIEATSLKELSKIDRIIAIKDSSGSLENMKEYMSVTDSKSFSVLSGSDSLILSHLKEGGDGAVTATSNLLAPINVKIYESFQKHDLIEAERAQLDLECLRGILKLGTVPSVLKATVTAMGIDAGDARRPVLPTSGSVQESVLEVVDYYRKKLRKYEVRIEND